MVQLCVAFLGGTALSALISQIGEYVRERKRFKEQDDSRAMKELSAIEEAIRYILYDRIRYLGGSFLRSEEIDFDDRRNLNNMHSVYHEKLGGNGDLDILMDEVNKLPLKINEKGV